MPTLAEREHQVETALAPIRGKLTFIAEGLELRGNRGEDIRDPLTVAALLRDVEEEIGDKVVRPMYGNGEKRRSGEDRPVHLSLDEDGVRSLVLEMYRLASATSLDKDSDEEEMKRRLAAIGRLSEVVADRIMAAAGQAVHDGTIQPFLDEAKPFGRAAAEHGIEAVNSEVKAGV